MTAPQKRTKTNLRHDTMCHLYQVVCICVN